MCCQTSLCHENHGVLIGNRWGVPYRDVICKFDCVFKYISNVYSCLKIIPGCKPPAVADFHIIFLVL